MENFNLNDDCLLCHKCSKECYPIVKNGDRYWYCSECGSLFDEYRSEVCWSIVMEDEE